MRLLVLAFVLLFAVPAAAQPAATSAIVSANAKDVASVEAITAALYETISGPAGAKRDWNRLRSLFRPEARMVPVIPRKEGGYGTVVLTVEDYIARSGPRMEADGFFERETFKRVERYQNIAHVFSGYEGRETADGPVIMKGVNSLQLMFDGQRWWIANLIWDGTAPPKPAG